MKRLLLPVLVAAMSAAGPLYAQTGTVTGMVIDQSGGVVPGATVDLTDSRTRMSTTSGGRGEYSFSGVAPGTYELTVSLVGFAQAVQPVSVGGSATTVPPVTLSAAGRTEVVVVSASRTQTSLIDAPATMSVVSSQVIESTPAQNYGDLLRSVPGVNVIQLSARDVNLTNRQATSTLSNTQLVLLDGRSIYLDFFGIVLWDFLPSNLSDIKQIEVVRGPASAVWGANALTGAVNVITKSPRESVGVSATISAGGFGRDAGSTSGAGAGYLFTGNATLAQAPNDIWSYRISAGYFNSDAMARPTGRIPVIADPRAAGRTVGGAPYPIDGAGPIGSAFSNQGTSQPKFDARVDQEINQGRITYQGGVAGTSGTIYTGLGPFDIQSGSYMGYGKVNYSRNGLKVNAFGNFVNADAPNLLLPDPSTGRPLVLNFSTKTYDVELSDSIVAARQHVLTFGGNARRNDFDITLAPTAENRTELGAYVQDEVFLNKVRLNLGARVDKFGNLGDPVFSPRLSATFKPVRDHALRVSYNRAFRSPSVINNFLQLAIVNPTDLSGLAPLLPAAFRPLVASPFPLIVRAVGSDLPIGTRPQDELTESSLDAYEVSYTGNFMDRSTVTASFYVNDLSNEINFVQLPSSLDPYTSSNPPPGWQLPAQILDSMALQGIFLPRTAFTYLNLGPVREKGVELSLDHRVTDALSAFANYSWQAEPAILDDDNPYPSVELALPPTNRFNAGVSYNDARYLGTLSANYSDKAFWSDVLTSPYHGFTDAFTMVNGSFGVKWMGGKVTTMVKANNIFNKEIQQHVFGDIIKGSVVGEIKVMY
jgi:outer membrane receptor protein involved in Fe transport